ncbi:helix-turn-helix transcriptional regulator [Dactylosporangium sp. NPDC051485]|uniref:helix-turn-helix domain-containing protein n=1 Tax=Dactylosporangium sp. NPDC051485 TaxID=3154846 RepID=UPI00341375F8
MAQRPRQLTPHRSGLDQFGSELRSWRVRRGLSQDALGRLVHVSGDLIGKVEKAVRRPTRMLVESCDTALDAQGALLVALASADESPTPAQADSPAADVGEPTDPLVVSGSLNDAVNSWQQMLAMLTTATDDHALVRAEPIVRGQLQVMARLRTAGLGSPAPDLMVVEALWAEFLSWIHDNTRPLGGGARWLDLAERLASDADAPAAAGYMLMRRSQQAIEGGDPATAIALARRAQTQPALPPGTQALSVIREAQGLAHAGDESGSRGKIQQAYRLAAKTTLPSDELNLSGHCTLGYVAAHEAYCRLVLGDPAGAAAQYEHVLGAQPIGSALDEGLWRGYLAQAYAATDRLDLSASQASQAIAVAPATASTRTMRPLNDVAVALRRSKSEATAGFLVTYRAAAHAP